MLASLKRDWEVLQVLLPWTGLGLRSPSSFCLLLQANESGDELLEQGIKTLVRKQADREREPHLSDSHLPFHGKWGPLFIEGAGLTVALTNGRVATSGRWWSVTLKRPPAWGRGLLWRRPTVEHGYPSLCPPPGLRAQSSKVPQQKATSQKYQPCRQSSSRSQWSKSCRRERQQWP